MSRCFVLRLSVSAYRLGEGDGEGDGGAVSIGAGVGYSPSNSARRSSSFLSTRLLWRLESAPVPSFAAHAARLRKSMDGDVWGR